MNVAIIGSTSFLAQYIIRELVSNNLKPTLYGKYPSEEFLPLKFIFFNFPEHPINYPDLRKYDVIIYTAGAGIQANLNETAEVIYELNSFIPIRLANVLSQNNYKGKLLTFGSYFEIGNEPCKKYYLEDEILISLNKISNDYGTSKRLLSRYLSSSTQTPDYYHLFLPNIYGKGENPERLIPYLINALKNNEEIKLTSGTQLRQYLHAEDIAKTALDIIKENYPKGFYNLCRSEAIRIKELVKKIYDLSGHSEEFDGLPLFGSKERSDTLMPYLLLNNTKAIDTFKFQPQISIENGIKTYLQ